MDPRGVDEDDLDAVLGEDAADGLAGRVRARRVIETLVPIDLVQQRRLADVGPADDGGEARAGHDVSTYRLDENLFDATPVHAQHRQW